MGNPKNNGFFSHVTTVFSPSCYRTDAQRCLSQTGCAAVMSAEALLEKPDLFVEDEVQRGGWEGTGLREEICQLVGYDVQPFL